MFATKLIILAFVALYGQIELVSGYFLEPTEAPTRSRYEQAFYDMCDIECSIAQCVPMNETLCSAIPKSKYHKSIPHFHAFQCNCCNTCEIELAEYEDCAEEPGYKKVCGADLECGSYTFLCEHQ